MRKFLFAALAALSTIGFTAPAQASNAVFVTYGDGFRGDYYRGYDRRFRGGYYYDDRFYRPRFRGNRGFRGGFRNRYRNFDRFDRLERRKFRRFRRDFYYY